LRPAVGVALYQSLSGVALTTVRSTLLLKSAQPKHSPSSATVTEAFSEDDAPASAAGVLTEARLLSVADADD
jgi:hypothetical protein